MKGYLLIEKPFKPGEEAFVESKSSENNYAVVFEDDTDTGYFYALELSPDTGGQRILDALHIYNVDEVEVGEQPWHLKIIWSRDWLKCALVINSHCHAVFDFENQGGYNLNEFPPPNGIWTKGDRKLTNALINDIFK
jgi:hypothetical protein